MAKLNIPNNLPKCKLIEILAKRVEQRDDIEFNFFGVLDEFRKKVSEESRQINELFPEFTPHDELYHLRGLFHVADTILGRDRLEQMNSAEIFVLAVALYGHDWGMAVSKSEEHYIITGKPYEGEKAEDLRILSDDRERFDKFMRKERLTIDKEDPINKVPIEKWREFVRQTHALRSSERVKRYFMPISGGVADAASRVCVGHWIDFEDLQDPELYPIDFALLRETVNLRAITVYLRLIDLLDLGEDRTPFAIWKFVAPRDPRSKMEWKKHLALRPVTCPPYQEGRIIRVEGSTEDHEVYAALEDLRIWCEEQFRGCNDILSRMNDPRHQLDLYHIDWRIAATGFKKLSIKFGFDRERMFEILSDEIYQGDPYVFLRELLQNSIDAIRMRREVLQRRGVSTKNLGVIRVTIDQQEDGDAIVSWSDDGIGMDEYIISKYLALAGKSYYRSSDFERVGLKMDPISRFGIGILSCFMVADRVEIETFKDPYLPPPSQPLKIVIPDRSKQFRIEVHPQENAHIGTTIRVFVKGKKISTAKKAKTFEPLDMTSYLTTVAGFVEFPIVITEGDRKTIVIHPKQDTEAVCQRFDKTFNANQLGLEYPWEAAILAQDLPVAREMLREVNLDINSDLNLKGYDGALTYLVPIKDTIDLKDEVGGIKSVIRGQHQDVKKRMRWSEDWKSSFWQAEPVGLSRSSSHYSAYSVYRDGILVPEAPFPSLVGSFRGFGRALPSPKLIVNLPKSIEPEVDLARIKLRSQAGHWASQISWAHLQYIYERSKKKLLSLDPAERLYQMGRLIAFHNIDSEALWQIFPQKHWPLPFLEAGGCINVLEWQEVAKDAIFLVPSFMEEALPEMCFRKWIIASEDRGSLFKWQGDRCLIFYFGYIPIAPTVAISSVSDISSVPLGKSHAFAAARFLHSPWGGDPPLLQKIMLPMEISEELPDVEDILKKAVENPTQLNPIERRLLYRESLWYEHEFQFPEATEFLKPYEQSFAYGWQLMNLNHPVAQTLLRFIAAIELAKRRNSLPDDQFGKLMDALESSWPIHDYRFESKLLEWEKLNKFISSIWLMIREMQMFDEGEIESLALNPKEFVPGTIAFDQDSHMKASNLDKDLWGIKKICLFGKPRIKK